MGTKTAFNGIGARARAEAFDPRFKFTPAASLEYVLDDISLVQDLLPLKRVAAFYGAPGCGKSFGAIDLSICLGAGIPYAGKRIERAYAIYIVAEGGRRLPQPCQSCDGEARHQTRDVALELIHAAPNLGKRRRRRQGAYPSH